MMFVRKLDKCFLYNLLKNEILREFVEGSTIADRRRKQILIIYRFNSEL